MITDVDKHGHDRANPLPNRHDLILPEAVMAKGTNSTNYTTPSTNLNTLEAGKNGQFTIVQTGSYALDQSFGLNNPGTGNFGSVFGTMYQAPHNLGYTPGVIAFVQRGDGTTAMLPYISFTTISSSTPVWFHYQIRVDSQNVYVMLGLTAYQTGVTIVPGISWTWYLLEQTSQ